MPSGIYLISPLKVQENRRGRTANLLRRFM